MDQLDNSLDFFDKRLSQFNGLAFLLYLLAFFQYDDVGF